MFKIIKKIKSIFHKEYDFTELSGKELNAVLDKIINSIRENEKNELFG